MEEENYNQPTSYGATPHVALATTPEANSADGVATPTQEDAPPVSDAPQTVVPTVDSPTPPPVVDDSRYSVTVGDAVFMGRERGYERTPRKWQEDSKRGIVDAVKRRVGDQEAWFMDKQSVATRLASLIDRANVQRPSPTPPSARPDATTPPDQAQRPTQEDAPSSHTTADARRISDGGLDELDPFDMPDDSMLLKRYIYKQRNRLELAKMKEEQLGNALVDQREEVKSMRQFLGGEGGIVRVMTDAMSRLGLGGGRREERDRE